MKKKKLIIATHNEGKKKEFVNVLSSLAYEIRTLKDLSHLPKIEETGLTFKENAVLKAETISRLTGELVLADDSGLEVFYLGGKPGVYSARFAGDGATDEQNNTFLLKLMENIPYSQRRARFVCVIALAAPGKKTQTVEGICEGFLASSPRGSQGFGYDPLFIYGDGNKTFAEMDIKTKSRISHRGQALRKIRDVLLSY
ncbi:MAG TPA: XTP/dITP diphosphatase [Firmicutes bacterium]|jgi:XTP/dITP diphosphohydrolase|nr:XTP/dITP diphosphatase [Bacillota bacterium]